MKLEQDPPEYERPEIVDYGDLVGLTAGQGHGSNLDSVFHAESYDHPHFSNA